MHHSLTVDLLFTLSGSTEFLLGEDQAIELVAGDLVRLDGAEHGFRGGPDGCVMAVINFEATPVADLPGRA